MSVTRLQDALKRLTAAIRDVETELAAMKSRARPMNVTRLAQHVQLLDGAAWLGRGMLVS